MTLPLKMKELTEAQRAAVVEELSKAMGVAGPITYMQAPEKEHNIWALNDNSMLADAEEELYHELVEPAFNNMAELIAALGLSNEHVEMTKSLGTEFMAYQEELIKSARRPNKLTELWNIAKRKRKDFIKYLQGQDNWSKQKLKQIDGILKQDLPNAEKVAEKYAVRAAFIAKIRNKQDTEALKATGAYVDRFPTTIKAARHEGVVLTAAKDPAIEVLANLSPTVTEAELDEALRAARAKRNLAMHNYEILPLQPQEIRTVENAEIRTADKIAEVAEKHRAGIKQVVLQAINGRWSAAKLAQMLFDKFGEQNRDWRRVAITELAMASSDAFLAGCEEGDQVTVNTVEGSCRYCKQYLEGRTFTVTHKAELMGTNYSDEMNYVWVGKTNYGRRVATYIPCIPLHPNCRHMWHKLSRFYSMVDGKPTLRSLKDLINEERIRRGIGIDENLK